jgi:hypothetical protein
MLVFPIELTFSLLFHDWVLWLIWKTGKGGRYVDKKCKGWDQEEFLWEVIRSVILIAF